MTSKGLYTELSKPELKKLKFRYNKLKNQLSNEINSYGNKNNEFFKEWKEANEVYSVIQDSKKVTNYLESVLGNLPPKLAGGVAVELLLGRPMLAAGTVGAAGAVKTGELLYRMRKSPVLLKYYSDALLSASQENLPALINSLEKLDTGLSKSIISED